jgi:hypothetical protein
MKRNFKYKVRQRIWWHDNANQTGLITAIIINPYDETYRVQWSSNEASEHFSFELSATKPKVDFE